MCEATIDPAAVCRMLDSLEKGGFVARSAHQADRRADEVSLTPKGRAACAEWQACCRALEQEMLQGFTGEEARQFSEYLARAYHNLRGKNL